MLFDYVTSKVESMNYLIVDDEAIILKGMEWSIKAVVNSEDKIFTAQDPFTALDIAANNKIDIVFCDVDMPGMNGLTLAAKLHEISEDMEIVFATGYAHYSLDAWKTEAKAFVLKPVGEDEIRSVLSKLERQRRKILQSAEATMDSQAAVKKKMIEAKCFGNFELLFEDKPIHFARKKSKEMLAYLIDRQGTIVTTDEIRCALWEEADDSEEKRGYIRILANDIRKSFEAIEIDNILINDMSGYFLDKGKIHCDYWDYLAGEKNAEKQFHNEYMSQYSWAEVTLGRLLGYL